MKVKIVGSYPTTRNQNKHLGIFANFVLFSGPGTSELKSWHPDLDVFEIEANFDESYCDEAELAAHVMNLKILRMQVQVTH